MAEESEQVSIFDREAEEQRPTHRRRSGRSKHGQFWSGVVSAVVAGVILAVLVHISAIPRAISTARSYIDGQPIIPPPPLGQFVPNDWRVIFQRQFTIDNP